MLLRRIIGYVKTQNWTAVILDFVIVVFGVFLGLQVQDWSTERDRRNHENEYLRRLRRANSTNRGHTPIDSLSLAI